MRWQSVVGALLLVSTGLLHAMARDDDVVAAYEQYHEAILRVASLKEVDAFISAAAIERRMAMTEDAQRLALFTAKHIHHAVVRISLFTNEQSAVVVMMVNVSPDASRPIVPVNVRMVREDGRWKADREDQNEIYEQPTTGGTIRR